MARRNGSLATERTDYSDRKLFTGPTPRLPEPFMRLEDFDFTAYGALLPPTSQMVTLIDPSRRGADAPSLDDTTGAMLETELTHCVANRGLADGEPATPLLRMAVLWGRLSDIAGSQELADRAEQHEIRFVTAAIRDLFLEQDANFSNFGYRYSWSATLILERYAEAAGTRAMARRAWERAASAHQMAAAATNDRTLRRAHQHMAAVDEAHAQTINVSPRDLVGHGDNVVVLPGHGSVARSERPTS